MIKRIKNKIIVFLLDYYIGNRHAKFTQQERDIVNNWVVYSYGNNGFKLYCEMRVRNLTKELVSRVHSNDEYIAKFAAINEVKAMQYFIEKRYSQIDSNKKIKN